MLLSSSPPVTTSPGAKSATPTIRTKKSRHEQAFNEAAGQQQHAQQQQDGVARKTKKPQAGLKVKSHLSACDMQRRKEHMHRLTSGIAITDRKVLNADMWTPGTDAYRERFYQNHQPLQSDTTPNISTILGETEPKNAFTHRKTIGLDKMARCKICEVEFLATKLDTTVTFKRIYDLRAKWKSAAADAAHEEEEKKDEHQAAEQLAKARAELLLTMTKKAAIGPTTFLEDGDKNDQIKAVEKPSSNLLNTAKQPSLCHQTATTERTKNNQQRSHYPTGESVPLFSPNVLYAPCRVCRFCSQYVGSYLDDQPPSSATPIVKHKAYLLTRNNSHHRSSSSSAASKPPTESQTNQIQSQNKILFPSSAQPILQICLQKRGSKKGVVSSSPLSRNNQDGGDLVLSPSYSSTNPGSPVSLIRSRHQNKKKEMSSSTPVCRRQRKSILPSPDVQRSVPVAYPLSPPSRLLPLVRRMCAGDSDGEDESEEREDDIDDSEISKESATTVDTDSSLSQSDN